MDKFLEAFINTEHQVLGQRLRPFCLAHLLYLQAVDSPVAALISGEQAEIGRRDLELAVLICSSKPYEISTKVETVGFMRRMRLRLGSFARAQSAFMSYLKDYATFPDMWEDKSGGETLGSPWILTRATFLLKETNFTESEIWGMPIGKLFWYTASLCELLGGSRVMSDDETKIIDEFYGNKNEKDRS